jgi:hypothetical protein
VNTVMNESSGSIKCGEFVTEQSTCWVRKVDALRRGVFEFVTEQSTCWVRKGDALRRGVFGCNRVIVLCDQYRLSRSGAVSTRVWVLRLAATAYTISESTGSDYRSGEVMCIPVDFVYCVLS